MLIQRFFNYASPVSSRAATSMNSLLCHHGLFLSPSCIFQAPGGKQLTAQYHISHCKVPIYLSQDPHTSNAKSCALGEKTTFSETPWNWSSNPQTHILYILEADWSLPLSVTTVVHQHMNVEDSHKQSRQDFTGKMNTAQSFPSVSSKNTCRM